MYYLESLSPRAPAIRNAAAQPGPAGPPRKIVVAQHPDAIARWMKLRKLFADLRGASIGSKRTPVPHTTNSDVLQLAAAWSRELTKVTPNTDSQRSEHSSWQRCMTAVKQHAAPSKPDEVYTQNESFWSCSSRLAVYLQSRKAVPSQWTLLRGSLTQTLQEVPAALGNATHATASAIANAGGAVSTFVKKPVNAALVVLGGAILLPPIVRAVRT